MQESITGTYTSGILFATLLMGHCLLIGSTQLIRLSLNHMTWLDRPVGWNLRRDIMEIRDSQCGLALITD